jgi:hypothetical protein
MKSPRALLFSALLLSALGVTAALSQTRTGNDIQRTQVPVVASPFQALANVLQNPDAVPAAAPLARHAAHHHSTEHIG